MAPARHQSAPGQLSLEALQGEVVAVVGLGAGVLADAVTAGTSPMILAFGIVQGE